MIFKQSISYHLVFIMILFRSRSSEKASSILDCEQSLPFLLRHFITRARARGEGRAASGEAARNEGQLQSLLLFCTFKLTALGSQEKWTTVHGMHHVN